MKLKIEWQTAEEQKYADYRRPELLVEYRSKKMILHVKSSLSLCKALLMIWYLFEMRPNFLLGLR